jgi:hypothetical protein
MLDMEHCLLTVAEVRSRNTHEKEMWAQKMLRKKPCPIVLQVRVCYNPKKKSLWAF